MPSCVNRMAFFMTMREYLFNSDRLLFRQFTIDDAALIHKMNSQC